MNRTLRILKNQLKLFHTGLQFAIKCTSPRVFAMTEVRDFDKPRLYIGTPDWALLLLKRGIDLETLEALLDGGHTACIGYNPKEKKWYGWSHRAMYGFGPGSEVKPGDCAYVPANREEYKDSLLRWYLDDPDLTECLIIEMPEGIRVTRSYLNSRTRIHDEPLDIEYGRGHWTATTLEEAKEMAIDFARGVG